MIKNNKKGFSLIELMVVVGIIGILASVAVPNLLKFQAKAKQTNAKTELTGLYGTEKAYMVEYNTYTPNFMAMGYAPDGVPYVANNTGCPQNKPGAPTLDGTVAGWPLRYYASGFIGSSTATSGVPAALAGATKCTTVNVGNTFGFEDLAAKITGTVVVGGASAATTFTAQSIGRISSDVNTLNDTWSINQNKELLNTQIGY